MYKNSLEKIYYDYNDDYTENDYKAAETLIEISNLEKNASEALLMFYNDNT